MLQFKMLVFTDILLFLFIYLIPILYFLTLFHTKYHLNMHIVRLYLMNFLIENNIQLILIFDDKQGSQLTLIFQNIFSERVYNFDNIKMFQHFR